MRLQILVGTYSVGSMVLTLFLLFQSYLHGSVEWHCLDLRGDLDSCVRTLRRPIEIRAGVGALIWLAATGLLIREWKKQ